MCTFCRTATFILFSAARERNHQLHLVDSDATNFGLIRDPLYNGDRDKFELLVTSVVSIIDLNNHQIAKKVNRTFFDRALIGLVRISEL